MNFADKNRYDRIFQQITPNGEESAKSYIKIFQKLQALSFSVRHNYSEDQFMHILLDNFHQGGKYTSQISSHQAELLKK